MAVFEVLLTVVPLSICSFPNILKIHYLGHNTPVHTDSKGGSKRQIIMFFGTS